MNKRLAIWATALLMAGATAQGATFPVITAFTNAASYTNLSGGLQTIVRVTVATPLVVSNQVFMRYTQGLATNLGFTSTATTNFRSALWPGATSDIAVVLYNNDRILISQTYTGNTYATFDVLQSSGGGGSGSGSLEDLIAGGTTNSGVTHLIIEGDSVGSHSVAGNTSTLQIRSNPTNITTGALTTDTVRANSMVSAGAIQVGAETPFSSFGELKTHLGLRDYVSATTYPNTLGGTPYTDGAIITLSEGASAAGGTTITLGRNIIVGQGGITVTNSLLYGNVIIISGNLTNSLEVMFPAQTNTVSRFYYRPAAAAPPYDMGYVDIPATTSGYLRIVGSTNSALLLAVDEVVSVATASNATLFAGNGSDYYRNFGNITNVQVWDDALQTLTETTFFGFEAGDGANYTWVYRTNGTGTNRILRLDVAGGGVTGACETCSNEWTEANIYSGGAILEYRGIQMKVSGNGNSNTDATHASVSPMGTGNVASANAATVGGGRLNRASGIASSVNGGQGNHATGDYSTVNGGYGNASVGAYSTVLGGYQSRADGVGAIVSGLRVVSGGSYSDLSGADINAPIGNYSFIRGLFAANTNDFVVGFLEGVATNYASITRPYTIGFYTLTTNQWRMGVGTNNPVAGLDVHGGFNFTGPITSNGNPVTFSASATDAVHTIVTGGDNVTSSPQRITFMAGSGSSPTSTVSGSNTTVYLAAGGSGGGTLTNAISTSTYVKASVIGGQVVVGTTGTPIFVEIGTGTLVEASLDPYATGAESTNIAGRVAESYGFANSNTIGNATSIQGQAWSATAPTNAGAYPFWNGSGWVFSTAAPASSTGSVSSINLQVGNITIAGSGVTTTGATINVSDSAPSSTAADKSSNNVFTAVQEVNISTQGHTRVDGGFDQAAYPRQHGLEVSLTNASPNGSTVVGVKMVASASTSAGGTVRDIGYLGGSQRVGTGQLLTLSPAGVQSSDGSMIVGSNLVSQTHEHPSIFLASGAGPSGGAYINFGGVENAANNAHQTVYSMARLQFGSSTGGFNAIASFNDSWTDRDLIVYGDTNEALFVEGSSGRVMVGGPIDVTLPRPQELMHLTNGSFRVDSPNTTNQVMMNRTRFYTDGINLFWANATGAIYQATSF